MESNFQHEIEKLKAENQALKNKISSRSERKKRNGKKAVAWTWKFFTGKSLHNSFNQWFREFHSEKSVSPDTSASLLTALVRRFVRVRLLSLVLLLFSLLPSLISLYILIKQNKLIETQNSLVEASRKSAYGFQLSNIFDAIDKQGSDISNNLIGRIVGISHSLKPYKILESEGELSKKLYSPERTQLLLFIANSNINLEDKRRIFKAADFSYCDLRNMNLSNRYLVGINLSNSNLENTNLAKSNLNGSRLINANLKNANISNGYARNTDFTNANLQNTRIRYTELNDSKLINTNLEKAVLDFSSLRKACLTDAYLNNTRFKGSALDSAYFEGKFDLSNDESEKYIEGKYNIKEDSDGFQTFIKK